MRLLALRGATTCDDDTKEQIDTRTQELVLEMLGRNEIDHDDLVSILFTATDDLTAEFPAAAARGLGLGDVPLLCARELGVRHGMARCIRVLMHFYADKARDQLHHVYLGESRALRDDLPEQAMTSFPADAPAPGASVAVLGTGLIGGSVGLALVARGVTVRGYDRDADRLARAVALGAVSVAAESVADAVAGVDAAVVAVPVGAVVDVVVAALEAGAPVVTDVGSVKAPIVEAVEGACPDAAPRFVGGHPMAGSEQDGVDGADASLFVGANWVLTPTVRTDERAFTTVRGLVRSLGAEVVAVTPEHHDILVAFVSHVPQLAASTLMGVATDREQEHRTLLRLAAGGFRDMTRIAAGHPGIWPDILAANRDAVLDALDGYLAALTEVRALVAAADRDALLALLERARAARRSLPVGTTVAAELSELRVPVPDRPGVLAEVTTLAGALGVNVFDMEIAHSLEGGSGVMVLVIATADADALESALHERGYHSSRTTLP